MDRTELYRVSTQILENIINDEKNDNNILFDMDIWIGPREWRCTASGNTTGSPENGGIWSI